MSDRPPTSVLLPTVTWGDACEEVAAQLGPDDELLVICDSESDPVTERDGDLPLKVRLVVAGEPRGCSGKANAIAAGMEAATYDRIVWTDDDFHHPPDWLAQLHADYDAHGPTTECPHFVGRDPLALLLEPMYVVSGTLPVRSAGAAWGGALIFERGDVDEAAVLRDLRRTVSDDGVLSDHCDFHGAERLRRVAVGGTTRETLERHVRFTQLGFRHSPVGMSAAALFGAVLSVLYLLYPAFGLVASTLFYGAVYVSLGIRRWTVLLGYPITVLQIPLVAYGLGRRTFVWGGRRYRWRSKYDVEIVGDE